MKKTIILGLATGIALTSLSVTAAADSQYPASDFQPKVVFIDKEAVKAEVKGGEPKCKPEKQEAEKVVFDPKYPAANFQPKVIYPAS